MANLIFPLNRAGFTDSFYLPKRIQASLVHLMISLVLVSSVLAFVMFVWYPGPYFAAMGVGNMLLILAAVDVTIGPFITLIIFNPAKASLKFDLAVIAIFQLAALMYGVGTVFMGRPVYAVYNVDMFTLVSAVDIPELELNKVSDKSLPITGPHIVGARVPADGNERNRILFSALQNGADLPQMPQHYLPYEAVASDVKSRMLSLDVLMKRRSTASVNEVRALLAETALKKGLQMTDLAFVPMRAKTQDLTVLVRRTDASIVSILPINPWGE